MSAPKRRRLNPSVSPKGIILKLAVSWLEPRDLRVCPLVCRQWSSEIDEDAWQVAMQNPSPVFQPLIESMVQAGVTYKNIALTLLVKKSSQRIIRFQDPNVKLKDFHLVIDVKDKSTQTSIGTWCHSLESLEYIDSMNVYTFDLFRGEGQYFILGTDQERIDDRISDGGFRNIVATWYMIRSDTGKSLAFGYEKAGRNIRGSSTRFHSDDIRPQNTNTEAGRRAMHLAYLKRYYKVRGDVTINFNFLSDTSSHNPEQLKQFQIGCVRFDLNVFHKEGYQPWDTAEHEHKFESKKDLLIFLDGLDWK